MQDDERSILFSTRYMKTKIVVFLAIIFGYVQVLGHATSSGDFIGKGVRCLMHWTRCYNDIKTYFKYPNEDRSQHKTVAEDDRKSQAPENGKGNVHQQDDESNRNTLKTQPVEPIDPFPEERPCRSGSVHPLAVTDILVQFKLDTAIGEVRVHDVHDHSALKGWLCKGDVVLSVNGEMLHGKDAYALGHDFDRRLNEKPDFEIVIRPVIGGNMIVSAGGNMKHFVCGVDLADNDKRPRDC